MNAEEANRTIAEYMGWIIQPCSCIDPKYKEVFINHNNRVEYPQYSSSLNALVPVWEKLYPNNAIINLIMRRGNDLPFLCELPYSKEGAYGKNFQEAAAIATAKAIQQLNKTKE